MSRQYLNFGQVSSNYYGIYISGSGTFDTPSRAYESVQIPGRNGDLLLPEKRLNNIIINYPAFFFIDGGTYTKDFVMSFFQMLMAESRIGYQALSDSYDPTKYRLGCYVGGQKFSMSKDLKSGSMTLSFNCKPQHYLTSGDNITTLTASGTISNATKFPAKPKLTVYGNGTVTFSDYSHGSTVLTFTNNNNNYIQVDCETCDCYRGSTNMNGSVSCSKIEFPSLYTGQNDISLYGVTKVQVQPRWYEI